MVTTDRLAAPMAQARIRLVDFLFAPASARGAAIFRIALAVMLPLTFWSVGGRVTDPVAQTAAGDLLYDRVFGTFWYALLICAMAVLFGAGVRPRITGLVLFVLLAPLMGMARGQQSRQIMLFTLLAFSALRSDAGWSTGSRAGAGRAIAGPMWPVRLIQLQLSVLYLFNAGAKLTPEYLRGDVLEGLSVMRPNFLVDLSDGEFRLGSIAVPVALVAIASVSIEVFLGLGFWHHRLRCAAAVIGIVFHLGLHQVVRIHMLGYVSMFLYLAFLLSWRPEPLEFRLGTASRVGRSASVEASAQPWNS